MSKFASRLHEKPIFEVSESEEKLCFFFTHFWECPFFHGFLMVFLPGGVFGGTLGGLQGVLGALLCILGPQGPPQGVPQSLQGVPPGASGSLWNPLGASRGASGRVPKRIQKKDLRAPSFSWFLFTLVFICLKRNMSGSQPASTAIQPASHNPASQPPRLRMPHRGESKGGGAAVCRREASSIDR